VEAKHGHGHYGLGTGILVLESRRVFSSELLARSYAIEPCAHRASGLGVNLASPVSAEIVREDKPLVLEALVDVTVALEVNSWGTELAGVRFAGDQARRNAVAREELGFDVIAVPLHKIVSTTGDVESEAERAGADIVNFAA
jgi:hypothetical protein